jgi:RNase P subunit RPR2
MTSLVFVDKICRKCGKERRFAEGSLRDKESICGNCWDWSVPDSEYKPSDTF